MSGRNARRSMADYSVATHALGTTAGNERLERYHEYVGRRRAERAVWPGAAFIVEALLLLVFLAGSLAVLMSLNADADETGRHSADLMSAMVMATNSAEEFSASPLDAAENFASNAENDDPNVRRADGLVLVRDVTPVETAAGVLYRAVITVWHEEDVTSVEDAEADAQHELTLADRTVEPVYTVETSVYVPAARDAAAGSGAAPVSGGGSAAASSEGEGVSRG